ncbi:MAG: hypothetical protein IM638_13615 [Bacteroidetes bacterium]|nr:hypothetical protein [Bacteroidota bacterium]
MKLALRAPVWALLLSVTMLFAFVPAPPVVLEEVIVQVPSTTNKNVTDIRTRLTAIPGVYVNGYCEDLQIYLIRVDRALQPGNSFLETVFHDHYQFSYYIKESCTIAQVRTMCGMPAEGTDPAQNPQ